MISSKNALDAPQLPKTVSLTDEGVSEMKLMLDEINKADKLSRPFEHGFDTLASNTLGFFSHAEHRLFPGVRVAAFNQLNVKTSRTVTQLLPCFKIKCISTKFFTNESLTPARSMVKNDIPTQTLHQVLIRGSFDRSECVRQRTQSRLGTR